MEYIATFEPTGKRRADNREGKRLLAELLRAARAEWGHRSFSVSSTQVNTSTGVVSVQVRS